MTEPAPRERLDKWLWHARFFKTRSLADSVVSAGKVRVDRAPVSIPSRAIEPGNVLTFQQGHAIRVIRILALAERRGPASEACTLYEDLSPPQTPAPRPHAAAGGRPTKRERRTMDRLEGRGDSG